MPDVRNKLSLIISSDQRILSFVGDQLALAGWYTEKAETNPQALELLRGVKWHLVFFSHTLSGESCLPIEQQIESLQPDAHLWLLADKQTGNIASPVRDIFCELEVGIGSEQDNVGMLRRWLSIIENRIAELQDAVVLPISTAETESIIGECPAVQEARRQIQSLTSAHEPCLITGEHGTGKLELARTIHELRYRGEGQMTLIMCEEENENFNTGRHSLLSEVQNGKPRGTIFINQIELASERVQAALLNLDYKPDSALSIIAGSCKDLRGMVEQGTFSTELYNRLKNYIYLPPLRDRREDIGLLIAHFVKNFVSKPYVRVSRRAWELLQGYCWEFNLPELHSVALNAISGGAGAICAADLPFFDDEGTE